METIGKFDTQQSNQWCLRVLLAKLKLPIMGRHKPLKGPKPYTPTPLNGPKPQTLNPNKSLGP